MGWFPKSYVAMSSNGNKQENKQSSPKGSDQLKDSFVKDTYGTPSAPSTAPVYDAVASKFS